MIIVNLGFLPHFKAKKYIYSFLLFSYVEMNVDSTDEKLLPEVGDDLDLDDIDSTLEWLKPKQQIQQPWRPWMNETETVANDTATQESPKDELSITDDLNDADEITENFGLENNANNEEDVKPRKPLVIRIRKSDRRNRALDENRNAKKVGAENNETESQNNENVDQNYNTLQSSVDEDIKENTSDDPVQDGIKNRLRPKSAVQRNMSIDWLEGDEMAEFDHSSSESAELNDFSSESEETESDLRTLKKKSHKNKKSLSEPSVKSKILKVLGAIENKSGFECKLCSKTFAKPAFLKSHQKFMHAEKKFSCQFCQRKFSHQRHLDYHLEAHGVKKKKAANLSFKCDICDKMLSSKHFLKIHHRIHTGEKPFKCSICKNDFRTRINLRKHMWGHTGETPYKCQICSEAFRYSTTLTSHMKKHNTNETK